MARYFHFCRTYFAVCCTLMLLFASETLAVERGLSPDDAMPTLTSKAGVGVQKQSHEDISVSAATVSMRRSESTVLGGIDPDAIASMAISARETVTPNAGKVDGVLVFDLSPVSSRETDSSAILAPEYYVWWDWSGSLAIPDASGTSWTWVGVNCNAPTGIPSGAVVTKVSVHHEITHTYIGDLQIKVFNDSGSLWVVRNQQGAGADNINETRTQESVFDGDDPNQQWYYRIRDVAAEDTGTLDVMQLYVYYVEAKPDLTPYKPVGWSNKIVVSNTTETNTDDSPLTSADTLYVDWAAINSGPVATDVTFYTELYVDGVLQNTWFSDPPVDPGWYVLAEDHSIGSLSDGMHTITIVVDYDGRIDEGDEGNNEFTRTITVGSSAKPNLTPYMPLGWSDKIVVSNATGTNTDDSPLSDTDTLYVDWAAINNGGAATGARFYTELYVDDVLRSAWYSDPPLDPSWYTWAEDYSIGSLSSGDHTVKIVVDYDNRIDEDNEGDNEYTKTITVGSSGGNPNLTPYMPAGWSDKIVVSNTTGTTTDASPLYGTDTLYVDWAVINDGVAATGARFYTQLYVDGALENTWYSDPPLNPNWYSYVTDYSIGSLPAGPHTVEIIVDYDDRIVESDEGDNAYTKNISTVIAGDPDIRIEPLILNFDVSPSPSAKHPIVASPDYFTFSQPDGTSFRARKHGDEFYHYMETEDGWTVARNSTTRFYEYLKINPKGEFAFTGHAVGSADALATATLSKHAREKKEIASQKRAIAFQSMLSESVADLELAVPAFGTVKSLAILANFSDTSPTFAQADFNELFNTVGYNQNGALGSVRDYYDEASYGNILVETTASQWVNLPHTMAFYGANDGSGYDLRPRRMVSDAIAALDAAGFDFAPFDTDSDGWIDSFSVIHQGPGEEAGGSPNTIWSHKWAISTVIVDGVRISEYHTEPETYGAGLTTIGVICHEFAHALGLPDLYDTDYSSEGIGSWGLMAGGSWNSSGRRPAHFCAWSKIQLGWVTEIILDASQIGIPVTPLSTTAQAYRIDSGMGPGEYLLIENRQKTGGTFDDSLPGSGLLAYHIDDNQTSNSNENRYWVGVLQADGLEHLENGSNRGDAGDPFPGSSDKRNLAPDSNPNTDSYYNGVTGIDISNISDSQNTMSFDLNLDSGIGSFVIYNDGTGILSVTSIDASSQAPWISHSPSTPFNVPAGGQQTVQVFVDFGLAPCGETTVRLLVQSNDPDESPYPGGVDIVVANTSCGGNLPPTISAVTATPSTISESQTSQLQVTAGDPDSGPNSLTYNWIVLPGQGSVDDATITNPVYTPPSVGSTQTFTLTVEVSDGEDTTPGTVDVTVTDVAVPRPPRTVDASDGLFPDRVRVRWFAVPDAESYRVYRAESISGPRSRLGRWRTRRSINDTSAAAGTTYYYWVRSRNSAGVSRFSRADEGWVQ